MVARENARQVKPDRLGALGPSTFSDHAYACAHDIAKFGSAAPFAEVTFVVEAWVEEKQEAGEDDDTTLVACVNRTPVTGDIHAARDGREINVFGCGLAHTIAKRYICMSAKLSRLAEACQFLDIPCQVRRNTKRLSRRR
jgi:hypothetical protein